MNTYKLCCLRKLSKFLSFKLIFYTLCKVLSFQNIVRLVSKASLPILTFLLEAGEANFSMMQQRLGMNTHTVYNGLNNLMFFHLISERRNGIERLFSLTSYGQAIAQQVRDLEQLLEMAMREVPIWEVRRGEEVLWIFHEHQLRSDGWCPRCRTFFV